MCCIRSDDIPTGESEIEQQYWYGIHPQKGWTFLGRARPTLSGWRSCPVNQSNYAVLPARRLHPEFPRSAFIPFDHSLLRSHWVSNADEYEILMQRELYSRHHYLEAFRSPAGCSAPAEALCWNPGPGRRQAPPLPTGRWVPLVNVVSRGGDVLDKSALYCLRPGVGWFGSAQKSHAHLLQRSWSLTSGSTSAFMTRPWATHES